MIKFIDEIDLNNKTVLLRVDYNVPVKNGIIENDARIRATIPTIEYILKNNAKLIIFSHLGRIKTQEDIKNNSLLPISKRLGELLSKDVIFVSATKGNIVENAIKELNSGEILMLENTRYEDYDINNNSYVGKESKNNIELGSYWASLGDVFVNDAFAVSHRECASICGIASNIKDKCAGFLLKKEIESAEKLLNSISRPYIAILGGAKVSDKIGVINTLLEKADKILIGGAMMFTFLKAKGYNVGLSKCESEEFVNLARDMLKRSNGKIVLPLDVVCNTKFENSAGVAKNIDEIDDSLMGLDIGQKTLEQFKLEINDAKTIVWNGPVGVFEMDCYASGTIGICNMLSVATKNGATTIIGGGETISAVEKFGFKNSFSHISTGGGAFLELLEGKKLAGIDILNI